MIKLIIYSALMWGHVGSFDTMEQCQKQAEVILSEFNVETVWCCGNPCVEV